MTGAARITVSLDHDVHNRVQRIAAHEHRSVAAHIRMPIERDLHARDEAERVIRVVIAPELAGEPFGTVDREDGETDAQYAARAEALRTLLGGR
jgi:predicted transcriptional regulator